METLGENFYSMCEKQDIDLDNYPPYLILNAFKAWCDGEEWKPILFEYDNLSNLPHIQL